MDKTEYRMRLNEINRLVDAQDYEGALAVADSIEWKRVKSVRTLCMVADIYEVNGELEESMRMLQLAYKRSSVGKMILYRQVELSLKMGRYDDAVKYYNQYLETAANDTSKYILKYKIYKAQDAPLEDQIAILEEYKEREYTERWVYELAKLYKKAGKQNKCVATCDDLILWFGEGKYVKRAMELKMTYVPLTLDQKVKYERMCKEKEVKKQEPVEPQKKVTASTVAGISAAAMESLQKASIIPAAEQEKKPEKPVETMGMEEAAAASEPQPVSKPEKSSGMDDIPVHVDTAQLQEKLAKSFQEVLAGFNRTKVVNAFEALGRATGSEVPPEPEQEENIEEYQIVDLEPETANETKISAERGEAIAHRTEMPEIAEPVSEVKEKPEDKEVTSIQDMDLEALFAETSSMFAEAAEDRQAELANRAPEEEQEETEAEEAKESPVIPEQEDKEEDAVSEDKAEEPEEKIELDADAEAAMAAFEASLLSGLDDIPEFSEEGKAAEQESGEPAESSENMLEEPEQEEEEPAEIDIPQIDITEPDISESDAAEPEITEPDIAEYDIIEEDVTDAGITEVEVAEADIAEPDILENETTEEPADIEIPDVDIAQEEIILNELVETEAAEDEVTILNEPIETEAAEDEVTDAELAEAVEMTSEEAFDFAETDLEAQLLEALGGQPVEESNDEDELLNQMQDLVGKTGEAAEEEKPEGEEESFIPDIDIDLVMELQKEKESPAPEIPETKEELKEEPEEAPEENEMDIMLTAAETETDDVLSVPEKETPEEKKRRILNDTRPEKLTDEQRRLFSYFSKVPGMDEQILEAIDGVYQHVDEKTSRRGNIAIMGSHGTGKTRLSEGLVKAICKELGLKAVKYANLDASDMNRKDPATVIAKMAGGFLLIERASFMNSETIEKLSQAMNFRTDSMILIIEDDKANMRKLLADYPEFAEKFHTVISIPVFTNDELVTFARTYAKENGYRMDEMGVLALYTLIGDNQREDEPITIGKVKEMVDRAIRRAGGARLGRRISKRHTDEEGRILLYEKDFDL